MPASPAFLGCDVLTKLDRSGRDVAIAAVPLPLDRALVALEPVERQAPKMRASNTWRFGPGGARRVKLPTDGEGLVTAISDLSHGEVALAVEGAEQGPNTVAIVRYHVEDGATRDFARLSDVEPEPVYAADGQRTHQTMQPSSTVMRSAAHIPHVRLLMAPDGGVVASIAADQSLKILQYDSDGEALGKRVLLPVVQGQLRILLPAALVARSGDRMYAVFPVDPDDERVALSFHGLDPAEASGRGGYLVLEMSASADAVSARFISSPAGAVLRPTVIDVLGDDLYVAGSYERGVANAQPFIARFSRASPHQALLPAWSSVLTGVQSTASVSAIEVLEGGRVVIGGMEGARQAATGSVLGDSPAYVALYDETMGMTGKLSWGDRGRNFVVAMGASSPCDLHVVSTEGHLLTHEDARGRRVVTVLSSIEVGGCP